MNFWAFVASLLLASGVALGAYGAHGLRSIVESQRLIDSYEWAVQYQLISALGFFAVAWATQHFRAWLVHIAGALLLLGTVGFSGSLYLLVLESWRPYPLVTPVSGGLMIAGWIVLAVASLTYQPRRSSYY